MSDRGVDAYQKAAAAGMPVLDRVVAYFKADPDAMAGLDEVLAGRCGCGCGRPNGGPTVREVIRSEERKYLDLILRNQKMLRSKYPTPAASAAIDGSTLAALHHTHGCCPETVAAALGIELPAEVLEEYRSVFNEHKKTGDRL